MRKQMFLLCWISLLITGCATNSHVIPQQGMTVKQLYQQDDAHQATLTDVRSSLSHDDHVSYTHVSDHFKRLPNPEIPIYIYPHLVMMGDDEVPVDGYQTAFMLYTKNHYALPSEVY